VKPPNSEEGSIFNYHQVLLLTFLQRWTAIW